jgi:hypothetical protein
MKHSARTRVLAAVLVLTCAAIGAAFVRAGSSGADEGVRAKDVISALTNTVATKAPGDVTQVRAFSVVDFTNVHELGRNLGRFHSSLLVAPGRGGRSVCYMLDPGSGSSGVGTGYCHPLGDIAQTARDHYSVLTPGTTAANGVYYTQLVGIAFDDVSAVRVRVDGTWRSVPIVGGNGFYLDVKGQPEQLKVELQDGSVETRVFPAEPSFARGSLAQGSS